MNSKQARITMWNGGRAVMLDVQISPSSYLCPVRWDMEEVYGIWEHGVDGK